MTRATFRPIVAGEPAWQKQLRDRYTEAGPDVDPDLGRWLVRPVSRAMATQVILRYEWLGTLPPVSRYFGLFAPGRDGLEYLAGATAVAVGNGTAGAFTAKQYGLELSELATLTRGACVHWAPTGANSRLVSWTTKLLARLEPSVRLVVAYADSEAGEVGTIYQACGWTYIGPGSSVVEWVSPSGRVVNTRFLGPTYRDGKLVSRGVAPSRGKHRTRQAYAALEAAGWRPQDSNPKGRYVLVLRRNDVELASRVSTMALPYPKRDAAPTGPATDRTGGAPAASESGPMHPEAPAPGSTRASSGRGDADDAPGIQPGEEASRPSARSTTRGRTRRRTS